MSTSGLTVRSPAKINWTLRVLGRRADGFHEIESLVSTVTLYDQLVFTSQSSAGFTLTCDRPEVPADRSNLIWRAAELFGSRAEVPLCWACHLSKRIPLGGGLGGGSSNAAAALTALSRLSARHWPVERLAPMAAELGSDVSLFLHGGSCVISGRGERVQPVQLGWRGWMALLMPGLPVSTAEVYRAWAGPAETEGGRPVHPRPCAGAVAWMEQTYNMLERPACQVCPALGEWFRRSTELADRPVRVSGSGSTLFTAFDSAEEAAAFAARAARELKVRTEVVRPVEQNESV